MLAITDTKRRPRMVLGTSSPPLFREEIETGGFVKGTEVKALKLTIRPHWGQQRVLDSVARWVMMFGGTQVGKTCLGVHWLHREIQNRGAGDYLVITATYPLLKMKLLPEFLLVFDAMLHLGNYGAADRVFTVSKQGEIDLYGGEQSEPTRIIFGSAENPESLESATAKAAWCDEIGQKQFRREAWDAILRRLSLHRGRVLGTTTLYSLGWLKIEVYDKWKSGDEDIDIIQVDSVVNPMFSRAEYEEAKKRLPKWKFNLFYRGVYDKPAGLIYDEFDEEYQVIDRFLIPQNWQHYVGHDFGGVNPAALFYAQDPITGYFYLHRTYKSKGKDVIEQVKDLRVLSEGERIARRVGGSHQEEGWRQAYTNAGWKIFEPRVKGVEAQIDKVYGLKKQGKLFVFNDQYDYLDENSTFSRELDDRYEPTDKIEAEAKFHYMAGERYIISDVLLRNPIEDSEFSGDGYPEQRFY